MLFKKFTMWMHPLDEPAIRVTIRSVTPSSNTQPGE